MNLLKKFIGARAEAWTGAGQKNKEPEQVKKYLKKQAGSATVDIH